MIKILAFLLGLVSVASAQTGNPIKQSGHVTPGHPMMWTTNGIAQDAGTAVSGFLSGLGVLAKGPGICQNNGPQGGPYNQICLALTNGVPQIVTSSFGGATPQNPQFVVNGTVYNFPFTGPGTGIVGPVTTVVNELTCWNSVGGTAIKTCNTFEPTGTTAARTLQSHFTDHINVRDFGAVCDGSTDDTAAFNAAATYVAGTATNKTTATLEMDGTCKITNITWPSLSGSVKFVISGSLIINDPTGLTIPTFVSVEGAGGGNVIQFGDAPMAQITNQATQNAVFTGTGSGNSIAASGVTGSIMLGALITGTGVPVGTVILSQTSGSTGGAGTYITNHPVTSVAASITQGQVTVHLTGANLALRNMLINPNAVPGIAVLADGSQFGSPLCDSIELYNVGIYSDNTGMIGLEAWACEFFRVYKSRILTQANDGPSILLQWSTGRGGSTGYNTFDHISTGQTGVEFNNNLGANCEQNTTFSNWTTEGLINDPIQLRNNSCLVGVYLIRASFADNISFDAVIDNNEGGSGTVCTNVVLRNDIPLTAITPVVKLAYPQCPVLVEGWGVNGLNLGPGARNFYLEQDGTFDGHFLGRGTQFGPAATPWAPLAVQQNAALWTTSPPGTLTPGVLAPDGTTNAAQLSTSSTVAAVQVYAAVPPGFASGGWVIAGVWTRCDGTATVPSGATTVTMGSGLSSFENGTNFFPVSGPSELWANCSWKPNVAAQKITALAGGDFLEMLLEVPNTTTTTDFFMPWMIFVPPGTTSDDEVLRWVRHLSTVVSGAPQGTAGTRQPLFINPLVFSSLPGSPAAGTIATITDGLSGNCGDSACTTFGTNITGGGGSLKLMAWYNGSNWTLIGK